MSSSLLCKIPARVARINPELELTTDRNAFMFPCVYFFFPETRYRSLEEMDAIFKKSTNVFDVVNISVKEPYRYDKHGELKPEYLEEAMRHASADLHIAGAKFDSDESGTEVKA